MAKQKFQIGDKVALVKQPYTVGMVVDIKTMYSNGKILLGCPSTEYTSRKVYDVQLENHTVLRDIKSYELQFADLRSLAEHLDKHGDIPKLSKKEQEEIVPPVLPPKFQEGDIVIDPMAKFIPNIGKIVKFVEENGKYYYTVEFTDKKTNIYLEYQLCKGSLNDKFLYDEFVKIGELAEGIGPKENCKYCDTPFDEIEESKEESGACKYCVDQRKHISDINLRKSAYVDLEKFSIYGHKGDWLEVTEWTNGEGIDVLIHYANDHDETDHTFKLSYDEFTAIANIVNKFGNHHIIFTKSEKEN